MNPVTEGMPRLSAVLEDAAASPTSEACLHARHDAAFRGGLAKGSRKHAKAEIVEPLRRKLWLAGYSAEEARERNAQQRRYVRSAAWCLVLAVLAAVGAA